MAANTEAEQKELVRIWDAQETELAEYTGNPYNYLENDVLEIKREQYLSNGKWVTSKFILVTGTGGPHVEFDTNHMINVYWAGGIQEGMTYSKFATQFIDELFEILEEIYP